MYRCLFCEFVSGQTPCTKSYEDDDVSSFVDWNHLDGVHVVLYPRKHIGLKDKDTAEFKNLRKILYDSIPKVVEYEGLSDDYRTLLEDDEKSVGQDQEHIHITGKVR